MRGRTAEAGKGALRDVFATWATSDRELRMSQKAQKQRECWALFLKSDSRRDLAGGNACFAPAKGDWLLTHCDERGGPKMCSTRSSQCAHGQGSKLWQGQRVLLQGVCRRDMHASPGAGADVSAGVCVYVQCCVFLITI